MTTVTLENVILEATEAASSAAKKFFDEKLNGQDQFACGFAWVTIYDFQGKKIRANSKMGKALEALGIKKSSYDRVLKVWNPSKMMVQNVDTLEAGAEAYAKVLQKYGFTAYAGSRLD
jgi:DNA-directed RNA polymerase subunit N (RpoN/RPB10)